MLDLDVVVDLVPDLLAITDEAVHILNGVGEAQLLEVHDGEEVPAVGDVDDDLLAKDVQLHVLLVQDGGMPCNVAATECPSCTSTLMVTMPAMVSIFTLVTGSVTFTRPASTAMQPTAMEPCPHMLS